MALLFADGFHWDDNQGWRMWSNVDSLGWGNADIGTHASGRRYVQLVNNSGMWIGKNIDPGSTTIIIGFWWWPGYVGANNPTRFDVYGKTENGAQFRLGHSNEAGGGKLRFWRGGGTTLLGESDNPVMFTNTWTRIEMKVTLDNAVGAFEVKANGLTVLQDTNVDTQQQTTQDFGRVIFWSANTGGYYPRIMDIYICDSTGAQCNDFLGDVVIELLRPNGVGNYSQWTPNVGANWQEVDESTRDEDTTFNESETVDQIDTFNMETLTDNGFGDIVAVSPILEMMRKHDVAREAVPLVRISATDYPMSATGRGILSHTYGTAYGQNNVPRNHIWELNPADSLAWEVADINNAEFGYKLVT